MNPLRSDKRPKSLTEGVLERIRADILSCRLSPGSRLNIKDLSESHAVSPGAVREALSRLAAESLVIAEAQRGFQVAPVSADDLVDLSRTRIEIESLCLRRSVAAGDVDWEASVVGAFHRLSRAPERAEDDRRLISDDWETAHAAFHQALVGACDSPWLLRIRSLLYAQAERYRRFSVLVSRIDRDLEAEHRALMEAALARDAERLVERMSAHMSATTGALLEALGGEAAERARTKPGSPRRNESAPAPQPASD